MLGLVTDNFWWKLLSLSASVALWYTFVGETELATSIPAIVQYRNLPPDLDITPEAPDRFFVKLRGPATRLTATELAQMTLTLDLGNIHTTGDQTFTITGETLGLPPRVQLVRVGPSQIRVRIEKRGQKTVPIEIRYAGPPPNGYRVAAQMLTPETARIAGPESRLAPVEALHTDPIDLSGTVGDAEFRVPVALQDPQIRFDGPPPMVTVRITLEKIPQ